MDNAKKAFIAWDRSFPGPLLRGPESSFIAGYAAGRASRDGLREALESIAALKIGDLPKKAVDREVALVAVFFVAVMRADKALSKDNAHE